MKASSTKNRQPAFVSIVMPCFNSAAFIDATLRSVSEQSFRDYELIVVDDNSTDHTLQRVEQWRDRLAGLRIIKSAENLGPGEARNRGIEAAGADLVALIDSDDVWFENKLEMQVALHLATHCGFSCTAFKFGDSSVFVAKTDYVSLLKNNVINTSTVMFDKSQLSFRFESLYKSEDYLAWLQISKVTNIQSINTVLVERNQVEGLSANKLKMARRRWRIYRQSQDLGFFASVYYFCHYAFSGVLKHYRF